MEDEGSQSSDEELIDLGAFALDGSPFELRSRPVEDTRALIAFSLLALLAGVVAALLLLLAFRRISVDEMVRLMGVMLAPLVGLVGAATGYYYGRSNRDR
jgi:hypothetical protein